MKNYSPIFKQMDVQRFRRIEHICSYRSLGEQLSMLFSTKMISENAISQWKMVYDECFADIPCCYFNRELEKNARLLYDMLAKILEYLLPAIVRTQAYDSGDDVIIYSIKSGTEEGAAARSFLKEKRASVIIAYRNYYKSVRSVFGEDVFPGISKECR